MSSAEQQVYNGRYELHRKIARGGMADVFLARDSLLDRPVALKVLFPEFATDPAFVERFRREAQSAANLTNPHIVSIYDWGEHEGTYFIVMEYVEGRSLAQVIRDEGPIHPDRAADITADIASALGFAHRNGVVHRDVKPGNVLMTPQGQVKVTDFGIARAVSSQDNLTQTGTVMGTATYFSPEQAKGESVDPRSDVYSLGIVLYEMLAGRPPFTGDNPVSVAYKHVQEVPEPVSQRNPDVPPALEAITHKAIAKEVADRYPSAEDFRLDLKRFRDGLPVHAGAPLGATAALGATQAMSATAAIPATRPISAFESTRPAPIAETTYTDEEPPKNKGFLIALGLGLLLLAVALFFLARALGIGEATPMVTVPDVIGQTQAEAITALEAEGFEVRTESAVNDEIEEGRVFAQNPEGGTELEEGGLVTLTVSGGPQDVTVPDLVGRSEADAVAELEALGLIANVVPGPSDTAPEGEVFNQSPAANSALPPGGTVRLDVSTGADQRVLPDVTGLTADEARARLDRDGFRTTTVEEASDDVESGRVIRTDPRPGAEVTRQDTITLVVSTGTDRAAIPNVIGRPADEATRILQEAGFTVRRAERAVTNPNDVDRVVAQEPAAGSEARRGAAVTITIGNVAATTTTTPTTTTTTTTTAPPPDESGLGDGSDPGGDTGGGDRPGRRDG
jgi:eukaryotic-like serine/threonine-protein kinase